MRAELRKPGMQRLFRYIRGLRIEIPICPRSQDVFAAFRECHLSTLRVVLLGQDPYHGPGQAHGLAFSVRSGREGQSSSLPPSLLNIFKEIQREFGFPIPKSGNLTSWARQGVLLLNSCLTVTEGMPGSHSGIGWEEFTSGIISYLQNYPKPLVFMLWGNAAREKRELIRSPHLALETSHPSPFSVDRGFSECDHFQIANKFLYRAGRGVVNWNLEKVR
jgi:uracil-DNA glycosylase